MPNTKTLSKRACHLLFQALQMLRKTVTPRFYDWKDADDWLFSELDITKSELAQIYEGREVRYYDGSAVDDSDWIDKPLTTEELLERREKPVWAIELAPNVDPDVPRARGWGIIPTEMSSRQYLAQDFSLGGFHMRDYGTEWLAFDTEQSITRYPGDGDEVKDSETPLPNNSYWRDIPKDGVKE